MTSAKTAYGRQAALVAVSMLCAFDAAAYKQYINVTREATEATGSNTVVVQVEVPSRGKAEKFTARHYAPDKNDANFRAVDIRFTGDAEVSTHSHTVAKLFFGSKRSIAKGISTAHVFNTTEWLRLLGRWDLDPATAKAVFPGPVVNHSWVTNSRSASTVLSRADYSALSNNILHVTGVLRGGAGASLMAGGYNTLVVGGAVKNIETPYPLIDPLYGEGRTRPHLVGPYPHASAAAPIAAAAAVRLNALAVKNNLRFSTVSTRGAREQLPVELVRAILMASASGDFTYSAKQQNYVNAFGTVGVTDNGLDKRYGMGMLNVGNAEAVLRSPYMTGGSDGPDSDGPVLAGPVLAGPVSDGPVSDEPVSDGPVSDGPVSDGPVSDGQGFFYAPLAVNQTLRIPVTPERSGTFTATLSWLADIQREGKGLKGRVDDFDLSLVAVDQSAASQQTPTVVASSASNHDTTENVRFDVERGHSYELVVTRKVSEQAGPWPVALAWNLTR